MRDSKKKSEPQAPSEPAYYPLDLRKDVVEKIGERKLRRTLSSLNEYEAVIMSIFTYMNSVDSEVEPQLLVDYYLDYKLSVGSMARKDLVELFKSMVSSGTDVPQQTSEAKKKWRLI